MPKYPGIPASWTLEFSASEVADALKYIMSLEMRKRTGNGHARRFSCKASCTRIKNRLHRAELLHEYLLEHTDLCRYEQVADHL